MTDEVTLTWENEDKVGVTIWTKTGILTRSIPSTLRVVTYTLSQLPKTLYVEGKQASDSLKDVTFTLRFEKAGSTVEDVVKVNDLRDGAQECNVLVC